MGMKSFQKGLQARALVGILGGEGTAQEPVEFLELLFL